MTNRPGDSDLATQVTPSWVSKNSLLIRPSAKPGASRKSPVYHFEYTLTMRFRERVNQIVSHGGVRHRRALTASGLGHKDPSRRGKMLPESVSIWRPIFMSSRLFDFETAICDCRSSALMSRQLNVSQT